MKKSLFTLALVAFALAATAQTKPGAPAKAATTAAAPAGYAEGMAQAIAEITRTGDPAVLQAGAAKMERAAAAAPTDWLPRYYQAYALTVSAFGSQDNATAKDNTLDQAEKALGQARQLKGDESELLALQAYVYQARLMVAPMERGQQYSELAEGAGAQARALNPANPRPYLIAANNLYHMPSEYGGGAAAARPLFEAAQAKFLAFKPATALAPTWGQHQVQARMQEYGAPAQASK
ncbi:hypothetical protein [Hymenobacter coccineus]|uniref:Uncharacterized protein n=1 Tax=Hymenobacter coccineus TaxID=1908235 RepID=A0A1G1SXH1_9BACT|nr:hypothetical protein [Hymenobacter coccineus]OGX83312.1 hypothetical protein BEN49_12520 [Hymenobacter coccineus]